MVLEKVPTIAWTYQEKEKKQRLNFIPYEKEDD